MRRTKHWSLARRVGTAAGLWILATICTGVPSATAVPIPPGNLTMLSIPDNGFGDCPTGFALAGARITAYDTTNKNIAAGMCKEVPGLTGPITTHVINNGADIGPGYNECPPGAFIVGVYKRALSTTDKNITRIRCQQLTNGVTTHKPSIVGLNDGQQNPPPPLLFSEAAWGHCPAHHAAIGIGTVHYDGGSFAVKHEEIKNMIVQKWAERSTGNANSFFGAEVLIPLIQSGVTSILTWVVDQGVAQIQGWLDDILNALDPGNWDSDEHNFTERYVSCVPLPSVCGL